MEKMTDVVKRMFELMNTGMEGLNHIESQLQEGKLEETLYLLQDVTQSIYTVQQSVEGLKSEVRADHSLDQIGSQLIQSIEGLLNRYREQNRLAVQEYLRFNLFPRYMRWKEEVERMFQPLILV